MSTSKSSSTEETTSDDLSGGCWDDLAAAGEPSTRHRGQGQSNTPDIQRDPLGEQDQAEALNYRRIRHDRAGDEGRKVRFAEEGYSYRASRKLRSRDRKRSSSNSSSSSKRRRAKKRGKRKFVVNDEEGRGVGVSSSDEDSDSLGGKFISLALGPSQNTVALVGFRSLVGRMAVVCVLWCDL
ncbi:hypothetical protein ElyMa_005001800 [Elysia marginata]|uniref:Uncharacterized protein n=1 Tax=Elysia marginata TaxID=1093978 RepID=A0AAV4J747_9GAST|nr:hypothetical protein ElyMa_005001800 [Elysia marginata]